ncbi:MAG: hypothetical protein LQ348_006806 [Seirophora lacunosa]|nr:MAG: hypothetical protein LQ348_006806 [Seirophora lacunosa]
MQLYIIATFVGYITLVLAADAFGPNISTQQGNRFNISRPIIPLTTGTLLPAMYHGNELNVSHPAIPISNSTLLPGYHRNVSTGAAWVVPASRFDLGARAMTCECFDPDGNHLFDRPESPWLLSSPNCMNNTFPPKECCPPSIPYCQAHESLGFGCFGTPTSSTPKSQSSTARKGTTTIVETVSINIVSSSLSLQFPGTITVPANLAGWSIATTYVFGFPTTIPEGPSSSAVSSSTVASTTSSPPSRTSSSTSATSSRISRTSTSTSTSTRRSTLCFDPDLQSPAPCASSPSDTQSPSSSSAPLFYPAATTLHSSAPPRTVPLLNLYYIFSSLALLYLFMHVDSFTKISVLFLGITAGALRLFGTPHRHEREGGNEEDHPRKEAQQEGEKNSLERIREVAVYHAVVLPAVVGRETVRRIVKDWTS